MVAVLTMDEEAVLKACGTFVNRTTTNTELGLKSKTGLKAASIGWVIASLRAKGFIGYQHIITGRWAMCSGRYLVKFVNNKKEYELTDAVTDYEKVETFEEEVVVPVVVQGITLNAGQREVVDTVAELIEMDTCQVLNVIGEGGSGKSTVIKHLKKLYGDDCAVTALTAIAAQNIGGSTLHSWLGLRARISETAKDESDAIEFYGDSINGCKILIIDEASMMGKKLFSNLSGVECDLIIFVQDAEQLKAVKDTEVDLSAFKTIELTQQERSKTDVYGLIKSYREYKKTEMLIPFNFDEWVGDNVERIAVADLKAHFDANDSPDKRVASYTNKLADSIVRVLQPTSEKYQLHNAIGVFDGKYAIQLAVNGEMVEVEDEFHSWTQAKNSFRAVHGRDCNHRTTWKIPFNLPVRYVSLVGKDTHFVKLLTSKSDKYEELLKDAFEGLQEARDSLIKVYGSHWRQNADMSYSQREKEYMTLKNGIILSRHICSSTVHKLQGQSVDCMYIMMGEMQEGDLMYVALSRAISKIVLVGE